MLYNDDPEEMLQVTSIDKSLMQTPCSLIYILTGSRIESIIIYMPD